jgi:very-short-patch-repair endonuclease
VARTLLDLASTLPFDDLEVALADARGRRLVRDRELTAVLERNCKRRGAQAFRHLIELARERGLTRSEAERRLLTLVRSSDLPVPQVNVRIGGFEVDFAWRSQRVIVEVDGYAFHSSARAFERDRERDATLAARGYVVLRVTWRQITTRPMAVVARLASALSVRT